MMKELTIGVIGLGGICRERHMPGFSDIPGVRVHAVANRTRASAERAAHDYDIPVICDTWQDIIGLDEVNLVLIGTWPYLHCEASVAALEAGKHVFCQARMARNAQEAQRMYAAAANSGRIAGLCPVPIGMSIDRVIARILRDNDIGPIRYVNVRSFSNAWTDPEAPLNWRKDYELSGLNMQTLGMYIEVIHRWFGWTRQLSAETFLYTTQRRDSKGACVEVRIPDQMTMNTVVGDMLPVQYVISGVSGAPGDIIEIHGEQGALQYDINRDHLSRVRDGALEAVTISPEERYDLDHWTVEQDFVNAIRNNAPYHPDFEDGLHYMQVIQAAYDSASSGQRIILGGT